jgi:DNA-binding transcriptional ArsR family regulator
VRESVSGLQGAGEMLSALADDTRLTVLCAISQAEMCVCDVAAVAGVSKAVASYHLRLLYRMGLVSYRKDGRLVYYSLTAHDIVPVIEAALQYAQEMAERSAPVPAGVGETRD